MWIPVNQELVRHPKTKRLARYLKTSIQETVGYLVFLWTWAADYAKDGNLSKYDSFDIADGCMLSQDLDLQPDEFIKALIDSRFLKETSEGLVINDWDEYTGKHITRAEKEAERKRRGRDKSDKKETSKACPQDIQSLSAGHPQDIRRTLHVDKIRKDKIRKDNKKEIINHNSNQKSICPHKEIIKIWNEEVNSLPAVKNITPKREQSLKLRWREKPERQDLNWWRKFIRDEVQASDFLCGRVTAKNGSIFTADFDWLLKPENFAKTEEGKYRNRNKKLNNQKEEKGDPYHNDFKSAEELFE